MLHWNIVQTIVNNDQVSQGLCKSVGWAFQCIVVLQSWGNWHKHAWNQDLRVQHIPYITNTNKQVSAYFGCLPTFYTKAQWMKIFNYFMYTFLPSGVFYKFHYLKIKIVSWIIFFSFSIVNLFRGFSKLLSLLLNVIEVTTVHKNGLILA